MIRNITLCFILCGSMAFFNACKPIRSGSAENFDVITVDTLTYNFFSVDTIDDSCLSDYKFCPNAKVSYPIFNTPDTALNRFLNAAVMKAVLYQSDTSSYLSVQDFLVSYFKENADMKKQGDYDDESSEWYRETSVSSYDKIGQYLTLKIFTGIYEGGAHPNSYVQYKVYDLISKRLLNAPDLLDLNDTTLLRIGERYFRKDNPIGDTMPFEDAELFTFGDGEDFEDGPKYGKFRFNTNFALTKEGVEFQYNTYEIGPYAIGTSSVTIPYKDIQHFLKVKVW